MHQELPSASRHVIKPERRATRATQTSSSPLLLRKKPLVSALIQRLCLEPLYFEDFESTNWVPPSVSPVYSRLCVPSLQKIYSPRCARLGEHKSLAVFAFGNGNTHEGKAPRMSSARDSGRYELGSPGQRNRHKAKHLAYCIFRFVRT